MNRREFLALTATGLATRNLRGQNSPVNITTARFNNSRTCWNSQETNLTPSNVSGGHFGLLGSYSVDGDVYTQPLYLSAQVINSKIYDVMIVASMHNTVYAFDANMPNSAPLWTRSLGTSRTSYPNIGGSPLFYGNEVGVMSTPVADITNGFLYVLAGTSAPAWVLNKLNLTDGTVAASVTVSGSFPGTGDPNHGNNPGTPGNTDTVSGGNVLFNPDMQTCRAALTLANSKVYVSSGGYSDIHPYHGWLISYNASTLAQVAAFCTTPSAGGGGLWMGGSGGPAVDGSGNIIIVSGNGDRDGTTAFGQSIISLDPTTLAIQDSYTPSDFAGMNTFDSDLGSGSPMMIPGTTRVCVGAKDYRIFQVDSANMGGLGGGNNGATAQVFATNPSGVITDHSGVYNGALFNNLAYFPNTNGKIYEFSSTAGVFTTSPAATTTPVFEFPGGQMSVSSNGVSNAILWAMTVDVNALYSQQNGTLRALNPATLAEYYNSGVRLNDATGGLAKYAAPTVANGKVFVSTFGRKILVFGLLPGSSKGGLHQAGGKHVSL